jgi:hypothetical protein
MDTTTTVDKTALTAKAKREYRRCTTTTEVSAWVAKHKDRLGYRTLEKIMAQPITGTKRTITVRYATACQKAFRATATKADVEAWYGEHRASLGARELGQIMAYPGTDVSRFVDG